MRTGRLDQILVRLGYAREEEITRALARQEARGGRLGTHLVELGVVNEAQLAEALAEQFDLPWMATVDREIPSGLVERLPAGVAVARAVLPLAWEERTRVLHLAVADPTDEETLERIRSTFEARVVTRVLAPESILRDVAARLTGQGVPGGRGSDRIELPELFGADEADPGEEEPAPGADVPPRQVLLVVRGAAYRNFLPAVVLREGCELTVVSGREEAAEALERVAFQDVLVADEMAEAFTAWVRDGRVPAPEGEVGVFTSVSDALLENPAPYDRMVRSLKGTVHALAEERGAREGRSAPWALMAEDLEALGRRFRMRRLALDGLHLAVHLLLPDDAPDTRAPASGADPGSGEDPPAPFARFPTSLEIAARLRFPFALDTVLGVCHALYRGRVSPARPGSWGSEVHRAAQMIALVWYRHLVLPEATGDGGSDPGEALRGQADRLASLELIEVYLRLLAERGDAGRAVRGRDVLVVGGARIHRLLAPRLRRVGCRTVTAEDVDDARTVAERRAPAAVVVEDEVIPRRGGLKALVPAGSEPLVYVVTESADPARTLALLDQGAEDVFGPPHDFDLVAARISRAVRTRPEPEAVRAGGGDFSASFQVFSFLDLIQALSHSHRTVRIDLVGGRDEEARIWLERGRTVHAVSGTLAGEEAVYRVIAWEDEGSFTVHADVRTEERTIEAATESVIMEGCRRLDEGVSPEAG